MATVVTKNQIHYSSEYVLSGRAASGHDAGVPGAIPYRQCEGPGGEWVIQPARGNPIWPLGRRWSSEVFRSSSKSPLPFGDGSPPLFLFWARSRATRGPKIALRGPPRWFKIAQHGSRWLPTCFQDASLCSARHTGDPPAGGSPENWLRKPFVKFEIWARTTEGDPRAGGSPNNLLEKNNVSLAFWDST